MNLKQSLSQTNRQFAVLLKTAFLLIALCALFAAAGFAVLLLGYFLKGTARPIVAGIVICYFAVLLVWFSGALALALVHIAAQDAGGKPPLSTRAIAAAGARGGFAYFFNAVKVGMVPVFGQIILICPCFLMLSNFIFSPHLFVYENLRGKKAEQRSVELARGMGWLLLNRTIVILFIAYLALLLLISLLLLHRFVWLIAAILVLADLYLALFQANFIRGIYLSTLAAAEKREQLTSGAGAIEDAPIGAKFKTLTLLAATLIVIIYIAVKILIQWKS